MQQWDATHQITDGLSRSKVCPACCVLCCRMDTLQCIQCINNRDRQETPVFHVGSFANNSWTANTANRSMSLVERKKRRVSVYCTHNYFDFVCLVESIFLANPMVEMMLAHNNGDIVAWIKTSILTCKSTLGRFSSLPGSSSDEDDTFLLAYIVEICGEQFLWGMSRDKTGIRYRNWPTARWPKKKLYTRSCSKSRHLYQNAWMLSWCFGVYQIVTI